MTCRSSSTVAAQQHPALEGEGVPAGTKRRVTVGEPPMVEARRATAVKNAPSLDPRLKTASGVRRLGGYGSGGFAGAARATLNRGSELVNDAAPSCTRSLLIQR